MDLVIRRQTVTLVRAVSSGMVMYKPDDSGLRVKVETVNAKYCPKKFEEKDEDNWRKWLKREYFKIENKCHER